MNLKKIASKTIAGITICISTYLAATIPQYLGERIKDENHLNRVIIEEQNKMGLNNLNILGISTNYRKKGIINLWSPACSGKEDNGVRLKTGDVIFPEYIIGAHINSPILTRGVIKHELAHIANGDCDDDKPNKEFRHWAYQEHIANIYGGLGINLGTGKAANTTRH